MVLSTRPRALANPGAIVFGTIAIGAMLAAETPQRETYAETVGAVAIALVAYWLAHAYAEYTAQRLEHRQPLTREGLARVLAEGLLVAVGAAIPLLVLLACWAAAVPLTSAVAAALWTTAGMIVIEELVAGVRAKLTTRALVAQTAAGAFFGLLVIALKLILH